jgi:hypothetical protein
MYRWPLPAQSLSGPSPLGLATVFYCLRSETSLFVASYDSSGKLSCLNVSANRVEVTSFNSTVIAFLAVTVLLTVRCRGYRLSNCVYQNPSNRSSTVACYLKNVFSEPLPSFICCNLMGIVLGDATE